ncbi:TlpA family protein disulfide reductase [Sandaracinus amylolyticus]|uniref:TlpA family protein disulfide reductase n=1 Tax=Sandaracinus amylolyticus TaxID=927083 RepID=UPI001F2BD8DF|nr:TlpA disulfide reductase family protein [Sandaracinus amylolyticus]UJR83750.1 Hypothetical protein I5071_58210 [Sandaracinus amylolyticus]
MRTVRLVISFALLVVQLAGCGSNDAGDPDAGSTTADSGDPAQCAPPEGPYGTSEGRTLRPFTLNRCDGTPFEFYGAAEGYCDATFTVLTIAAGWCQPCHMEAALIQSNIAEAYADRGVRVVQVLIQDPGPAPPTPAYCQQWVENYGITFPELTDPNQLTQIYFPDNALPATLIVDSNGVIVHHEVGVSNELETITAALDRLLGE